MKHQLSKRHQLYYAVFTCVTSSGFLFVGLASRKKYKRFVCYNPKEKNLKEEIENKRKGEPKDRITN